MKGSKTQARRFNISRLFKFFTYQQQCICNPSPFYVPVGLISWNTQLQTHSIDRSRPIVVPVGYWSDWVARGASEASLIYASTESLENYMKKGVDYFWELFYRVIPSAFLCSSWRWPWSPSTPLIILIIACTVALISWHSTVTWILRISSIIISGSVTHKRLQQGVKQAWRCIVWIRRQNSCKWIPSVIYQYNSKYS